MEEEKQWHEPISDEEFDAGKVSKLADRPGQPSSYGAGGLSASDLKAWFDKSATLLKDKLNKLLEAITDGEMSDTLKLPLSDDIQTLSALAESIQKGTLGDVFMVEGEYGQLVALAAALAGIYKNISDLYRDSASGFSVSGSDADQTHKIALELQNKNGEKIAGDGLSCHLELTPENKLRVVFKSLAGELLAVTEEVAVFLNSLSGNEPDKAASVQAVNEGLEEKVSFTDYATGSKAGVVKVSQGSATNIGITDGLIKVLKATEEHIAARGEDYTDYVLTASKTNAIVKAALTDKKKMALLDGEKATARETLGAASTEDVNGMRLQLSIDPLTFVLTASLLNTNDEAISTQTIDLPLEDMIMSGKVSEDGEKIILTLKNGETIEFGVSALVKGLATLADLENYAKKEDLESVNIELAPTLNGNEADKAPSVSAVNEGFANALKGSQSGTTVVLNDVSPISHNMKVSVGNAEDLSAVKVWKLGKNLFNPNAWVNAIGRVTIDGVEHLNVKESASSYYTFLGDSSIAYRIYFKYIRNSSFTSGTNIKVKDVNGTVRTVANAQTALPGQARSFVIYGGETLYFDGYGKTDICIDLSTAQLEFGKVRTDFEPFGATEEYAVNEDGTVNGVQSGYPSTVLTTDTNGAIINCEYNRDTGNAIDRKLDISPGTGNRIYAQQNGAPRFLGYTHVNAVDNVVLYGRANDGTTDFGGFLQTTTPVNPYNCANKKYVDDTAAAIRSELGKQVFTVSQEQHDIGRWLVPNGALPNFYLETTLFEYSYEVDGVYGENFAKGNFTELTFYDENDNVLDTKPATPQTFYEMPSGTASICHNGVYLDYNPPWDYAVTHLPDLKFQVKVGT